MMVWLLSIVGTYGCAIACVHLWHRFRVKRMLHKQRHYVVITHNNDTHIEWVLRLLLLRSQFRAHDVLLTVWDEGSEDDTVPIVSRIPDVQLMSGSDSAAQAQWLSDIDDSHVVVVRLAGADAEQQMPMFP